VLASPIPYNQHAIGVVVVFSAKVHPWSPEGELALVAFTDLAALAIANTLQSEERACSQGTVPGSLRTSSPHVLAGFGPSLIVANQLSDGPLEPDGAPLPEMT
jgi:hypothetical protein